MWKFYPLIGIFENFQVLVTLLVTLNLQWQIFYLSPPSSQVRLDVVHTLDMLQEWVCSFVGIPALDIWDLGEKIGRSVN